MRPLPVLMALCVLASASSSLAQQSDPINGCVGKAGKLRIVAVAGQCKPTETSISWNRAGPTGTQVHFVGVSTGTVDGAVGLLAFGDACQASFTGSHECTSEEIVSSPAHPSGLTGLAWTRPVIVDGMDVGSGKTISTALTCGEWTNRTDGVFGLVVVLASSTSLAPELAPYSGFFQERCNQSLHVACCAPAGGG